MSFPCVDPNHFYVTDEGAIAPQPWMQWRHVGGVVATTKTGSYGVTLSSGSSNIFGSISALFGSLADSVAGIFGASSILKGLAPSVSAAGNKNDLLHALQLSWTNDSPIDQWVYGKITRGGARVTLQARSRGGLLLSSGYREHVSDAGALTPCSMHGCGADMGRGGTLALGTTVCIIEERANSTTIPLAPERAGWHKLAPGATFTARVELRFISEFWENTSIDGGDSGLESSFETGDTRLDLFAVPVI